jgi:hypothetical protein
MTRGTGWLDKARSLRGRCSHCFAALQAHENSMVGNNQTKDASDLIECSLLSTAMAGAAGRYRASCCTARHCKSVGFCKEPMGTLS